jgi:restriction system protein
LHDIITPHQPTSSSLEANHSDQRSSFLFEKQLEDFLVSNWTRTPLAGEFEIYQQNGAVVGQQFRTSTGPIDILGQRKDKSDFLVVELKRDRASDVVVGQTLRYMGWVKEHLCANNQNVTGCIIAQRKDEKLDYALKQVNTIQFMRYEVDFRLLN